jgi:hypothetical protein
VASGYAEGKENVSSPKLLVRQVQQKGRCIMARQLNIAGNAKLQDYETFGPNEGKTVPFSASHSLDDDQLEQVIEVIEGVGGEIRLELTINAQLLTTGSIRISGSALLYEGTSENTDDLDGQLYFNFIVRQGRIINYRGKVTNTAEDEPEDYALVSFSCRNQPA